MNNLNVCLKIFIYATLPLFIVPFEILKNGLFEINRRTKWITGLLMLCANCFGIYVYAIELRPKFEDRDPFIILGYLRIIINCTYTTISTVQIARNYEKIYYFVKKVQKMSEKLPLSKNQLRKSVIVTILEVLLLYLLTLFFLYAFYLRSLNYTATRILNELSATYVYLNTVCGEIFFLNFIGMTDIFLKNLHEQFGQISPSKELWFFKR